TISQQQTNQTGLIYQDDTPVFWSPSSRIALSEAELEYNPQHVSKAIYATFALVNLPPKMAEAAGELGRISVLVWTTQPSTIPANQAINVNKNLFLTDLATEHVSSLATLLGTELESVGTFTGAELEGGVCQHPTISGKDVPLLPANLLTMGKGTGLVYTAPAYGMEDYSVVSQFKLTECMVDEEGRFNELAGPELQNQSVMGEGNDTVISMLKAVGALVKEEECVHSYDRGSKQPVVIRTNKAKSARGSLFAQLDRRPSWCISRQRSWGLFSEKVLTAVQSREQYIYSAFRRYSHPLTFSSFCCVKKAVVVHDFVVSEKGEKVLGNLVDPDTVIHGGKVRVCLLPMGRMFCRGGVAKSNVFSEVQIGPTVLNSARNNIDKVSLSWCLLCVSVGYTPVSTSQCLFLVSCPDQTSFFVVLQMAGLPQMSVTTTLPPPRLYCEPEDSLGRRSCQMVLEAILDAVTRSHPASPGRSCVAEACAIRDSFLSSIPGHSAAEYEPTIEIEPGLLLELIESLQDEPTSSYAQLTELMVSSWTTLTSALPRDMPLPMPSSARATFSSTWRVSGVIREDSAYQVAAVPTSMVGCRHYTSVSPDCPCCQTILTGAQ
uniref:Isoleucyl-tRNA synthetase 2, mitochondrial n=1 Tax=Hucho hucho TaxID=62062 RepID=A0A4W5MMD1_9TELE